VALVGASDVHELDACGPTCLSRMRESRDVARRPWLEASVKVSVGADAESGLEGNGLGEKRVGGVQTFRACNSRLWKNSRGSAMLFGWAPVDDRIEGRLAVWVTSD